MSAELMPPLPAWAEGSRPSSLEGLGSGAVENFIRSYRQDDWAVRGVVAAIDGFEHAPVEGYSAFSDEALRPFLLQNVTSLHLFGDSRSPGHSARIRERMMEDRERERALELGGASISRMMASVMGTTSLATLAVGAGPLGATAGAARVIRGAAQMGAINAATAFGDVAAANATLPGDLQRDPLVEVSLAAVLGAMFGSMGGMRAAGMADQGAARTAMSRMEVERLAGQHAAFHDAADGLRTPGVLPEWKPWFARPDADPERLAAREAALDRMSDAVERGDTAAYATERQMAREAGLVEPGDAGLRPVWQQTPTEAAESAIARNMDGGAAERLLDDTAPPARDGSREPGDLSAAAGPGVAERASRAELPGGVERLLNWRQMPFWRLLNNKVAGVMGDALADDAARLAQLPLGMMGGNRRGLASRTDGVEARARGWQWGFAQADTVLRQQWALARGWDPDTSGPIKSKLREGKTLLGNMRGGTEMTLGEFRILVGRALHTGLEPVDSQGIPRPEALKAAQAFTKHVFEPMEEAGADAALILTPKHAPLAMARMEGEIARLRAILEELEERVKVGGAGRNPLVPEGAVRLDGPNSLDDAANLRDMAKRALEGTERRLEELAEREGGRGGGAYAPQRWLRDVVLERRDELAAIFRRHFVQDGAGPTTKDGKEATWASNRVRAEVAVSHILREGMGDTLERVLRAHLRGPNMGGKQVAMPGMLDMERRLAELMAPIRALEGQETSRWWKSEVASALGKTLDERTMPIDVASQAVRDALRRAGVESGDSQRLVREILSVPAAGMSGRKVGHWSDSWRPANTKERQIDVPAEAIIEFLDTDISGVAQSYLRFMAPAVETAREFGDAAMMSHILARGVDLLDEVKAGRATRDEMLEGMEALANLRNVVQRIHAVPDNPDAYSVRTLRFLANYAILRQMGSSLLPNLNDVTRGTMSVGFMNTLRGMEDALGNPAAWRLAGDEAARAGAALDMVTMEVTAARNDMSQLSPGAGRVERAADTAAGNMQFINGVAPWTETIQRFFGAMLQSDMIALSVKAADGTISPDDLVRLRAFGIDDETASTFARQWRDAGAQQGGRLHLAATDDWMDGAARDRFRAMLTTAVDLAITKPGAADRPMFLSSPLAQVVFLYKGFAIASTQRMVMSGLAQRDMRVASAMTAGVSLAWLIEASSSSKYDNAKLFSQERIYDAINRSGWLGIVGDLSSTLEVATDNGLGLRPLLGLDPPGFARAPGWGQRTEAVMGAGFSPFFSAIDAFTGADGTQGEQAGTLRRLIPFQNWLPIAGFTRSLSDAAKDYMPGLARRPQERAAEVPAAEGNASP